MFKSEIPLDDNTAKLMKTLGPMSAIEFFAFYEELINTAKNKSMAPKWCNAIEILNSKCELFIAKAKEYKLDDLNNEHKNILLFIKVVLAEYLVSPGLPYECLPDDLSDIIENMPK